MRKVAKHSIVEDLDGQSIPASGRDKAPDEKAPTLSTTVKSRKRLPAWLKNAMNQAEASTSGNKLPILILRQDGAPYEDALVLMRLKDLSDDLAEGQKPEPERRDESASRPVVEIWTDGGCRGNPGKGAWAAVIYDGPKPKEVWGAEPETTNNRQELRAAIEALKALEEPRRRVRLHSDSAYLVNPFHEGWVYNWERNGWRTAAKKPVKNGDLWRELLGLTRRHQVEFVKVAGHAGVPANERCHALVQLAMDRGG
jgi:ribonuclease HI